MLYEKPERKITIKYKIIEGYKRGIAAVYIALDIGRTVGYVRSTISKARKAKEVK